jgi:hypothetical protein
MPDVNPGTRREDRSRLGSREESVLVVNAEGVDPESLHLVVKRAPGQTQASCGPRNVAALRV